MVGESCATVATIEGGRTSGPVTNVAEPVVQASKVKSEIVSIPAGESESSSIHRLESEIVSIPEGESESSSIQLTRYRINQTKQSIGTDSELRPHQAVVKAKPAPACTEPRESNGQAVALHNRVEVGNDEVRTSHAEIDTKFGHRKLDPPEGRELKPRQSVVMATPAPAVRISQVRQKTTREKQKQTRSSKNLRREEKQLRAVMGIHSHGVPFLGDLSNVAEVQSLGSELTSSFLPEVKDFVVGEVCLDRGHQTARIEVHAGPHARATVPAVALLDTGSPQSFISGSVSQHMLKMGAMIPEEVSTTENVIGGVLVVLRCAPENVSA